MDSVVIVCDLADHFLDNRIFSEEIQKKFPWGASFWKHLKQLAESRAIEIVTADIFLAHYEDKYIHYQSFLISDMVNSRSGRLLEKRVIPFVLYSLESPNVAIRFYQNIRTYAKKYRYTILFEGINKNLNGSDRNLTLYWPNTHKSIQRSLEWNERKLICMIASNKSRLTVLEGKPFKLLRLFLKRMYLFFAFVKCPWLRSHDLYQLRVKAITHFINNDQFSLFGLGWEKRNTLSKDLYNKIQMSNPASVDDKIVTLSGFKFCLCFENCSYPGYVTEKIFDCFFSQTIPIYMGAPDICNFIPKDVFVDFREFDNDFDKLLHHLNHLTESDCKMMLSHAQHFLESISFKKFTDTALASRIFTLITNFHGNG